MKVLFLDIDGVLNSMFSEHLLERNRIARVNQVIERTGAAIVISSDWRKSYSVDEIAAGLRGAGLVAEVIGSTPIVTEARYEGHFQTPRYFSNRAMEIIEWLDTRPDVERWAVVDDKVQEFLEGFPEGVRDRVVDTSRNKSGSPRKSTGIERWHMEALVKALNG